MSWRAICFVASVLLTAALAPEGALADDAKSDGLEGHYFMVVWAYEGAGNAPKDAHSFISFYDGDELADGGTASAHTISWLPSTGVVHPMEIERGRNFSLAQTLALACQTGKRVSHFGPYEIKPELYRQALKRIALLNSGSVAYSPLNGPGRMNCIEAAGDITDAYFDPGSSWGAAASEAIVRHLTPYLKKPGPITNIANTPFGRDARRSAAVLY
jgi:hypothetical protein